MAQTFTVDATIQALDAGSPVIQLHKGIGWLPTIRFLIDEYTRPGGTASGMQRIGQRAEKRSVPVLFAADTVSDVGAAAANLEALVGRVAQITDCYGRSLPRVKVTRVTIDRGPIACSGAAAYRVEATLELELLVNPPLSGHP